MPKKSRKPTSTRSNVDFDEQYEDDNASGSGSGFDAHEVQFFSGSGVEEIVEADSISDAIFLIGDFDHKSIIFLFVFLALMINNALLICIFCKVNNLPQ